jgi:hypothetical protein
MPSRLLWSASGDLPDLLPLIIIKVVIYRFILQKIGEAIGIHHSARYFMRKCLIARKNHLTHLLILGLRKFVDSRKGLPDVPAKTK